MRLSENDIRKILNQDAIQKPKIKAVGYCRFSSENQREESIEAQKEIISEYAEKNNYEIIDWYTDKAFSGTNTNRPDFQRMLEDVTAKDCPFSAVLVHKTDRFSRNAADAIKYKEVLLDFGVELISTVEKIDNTANGKLLYGIMSNVNEYYSANLGLEIMKVLKLNAERCLWNGGKPPLGYDVIEQRLVINESEAIIVREIFEMAASGMGYCSIVKELNSKGLKTKRGQPFGKNSIYDLLRNEKYKGVYVYNRSSHKKSNGKRNNHKNKDDSEIIRVEGGCPAIVSEELWNRANYSREITSITSTNARHDYLLTGLISCGICGSKMHGNYRNNGNKKAYATYRCNKKGNQALCDCKEIRADILEDFVINCLQEHFFNESVIDIISEQINLKISELLKSDSETIKNAKNSLTGLRTARANLTDTIAEIGYNKALADKLNALEAQISEYEGLIAAEQKQKAEIKVTKEDVKRKISELKEVMRNPKNIEQTKMVLRQYIESVRITNQSVEVTFKVAFAFFIAENEYNICYNHSKKEYRFLIDKKGNECRTTPEKHRNIENLPHFGSVGDDAEAERTPNPYRIESSVVEAWASKSNTSTASS